MSELIDPGRGTEENLMSLDWALTMLAWRVEQQAEMVERLWEAIFPRAKPPPKRERKSRRVR